MIVVDAAIVVDLLTQAPGADRIVQRLVGEDLHAPHLLDTEVVSALRGLVLGGRISESRAMDALTDYDDLSLTRWGTTDSHRRLVLDLRDNVTAYDATYLVLASELDCPLLTRDARLGRGQRADVVVEVI
jgi:predicted nucleic acid-binding protein